MTLNKGIVFLSFCALAFCCAEASAYDRYADDYVDAPAPTFFEAQPAAPAPQPVVQQPAAVVPAPAEDYSSYKTFAPQSVEAPAPAQPKPAAAPAPVVRKPAAPAKRGSLKQLLAQEHDEAAALLTRFYGKNINAHVLSANQALRAKGLIVIPSEDIILTAVKTGTPVYTMKCEALSNAGSTMAAVKPHTIDCGSWHVNLEEKTVNPADTIATNISAGKK